VEKRFLWTFAVGHFALGYLLGKGSAKLAKVKINIPLLLAASVLPDVDLLLRFLMHRGPTHSFIAITVLMIPFFIAYRKKAIPYYAALLSHIFIGDFFTGGIELLWPLSQGWFETLNITTTSLSNIAIELALFALTLLVMYKLGDFQTLLRFNSKGWALIIPLGSILGPLLSIGQGQENALPILLGIPSLFYLVLFSYSLIVWLKGKPNQGRTETKGKMEKLIKANPASYKSDSK
jgi:membrane-bound metal-dependent hydrolase YbcI (DUF457 family)